MASRILSMVVLNQQRIYRISYNSSKFCYSGLNTRKQNSRDLENGDRKQKNGSHEQNQYDRTTAGIVAGGVAALITGGACIYYLSEKDRGYYLGKRILKRNTLEAEEGKSLTEKEANFRRTHTLDKIFDYFATYRYVNKRGKNVNLMSIKDFYNAVTPGSTITHGTGLKSESDYSIVTVDDLESDKVYQKEEIPVPNSILNRIQKHGLLSYTDFCFLMNILATPRR